MKRQMNKSRFVVCMAAGLLSAVMLFTGCGNNEEKAADPIPENKTIEASNNSFGARYSFTLDTLSRNLAKKLSGEEITFDAGGWEILSTGLVDDNGVAYSSYCRRFGSVTFTAAAEDESGRVMNIGCGCQTDLLEDDDYRSSFLQLMSLTAACAGGYDDSAQSYLENIFETLLDGDVDTLCYEGSLYIKSVDDNTTVLMCVPCSADIISKNDYEYYSEN